MLNHVTPCVFGGGERGLRSWCFRRKWGGRWASEWKDKKSAVRWWLGTAQYARQSNTLAKPRVDEVNGGSLSTAEGISPDSYGKHWGRSLCSSENSGPIERTVWGLCKQIVSTLTHTMFHGEREKRGFRERLQSWSKRTSWSSSLQWLHARDRVGGQVLWWYD